MRRKILGCRICNASQFDNCIGFLTNIKNQFIIDKYFKMSGLFKRSMQAIKKQKQEAEEKIKIGDVDFSDLSSSQQQKLKARGAIKSKRIQKHKKQEPQWEKGKIVKDQQDYQPKHKFNKEKYTPKMKLTYTITFSIESQKLNSLDLYKLLNSYKIYIQQLNINYPVGKIIFGSEQAADKSYELLSKSQIVKDVQIIKPNKVQAQKPPTEIQSGKSNIFSRFS